MNRTCVAVQYIPNALSVLRMILSLCLLPIMLYRFYFVLVYICIGLTDVFDGAIARKYGVESELGARLDSLADLVFYLVLTFLVFEHLVVANVGTQVLVLVILGIRLLNTVFTKWKYKRVIFVHTIANKIAGLIVYCLPLFWWVWNSGYFAMVLIGLVLVAALEELLITMVYTDPEVNRASIFSVKR